MKKMVFVVLALQILLMPKLFSQSRPAELTSDDVVMVAHTVSLGETVRLISQKYLVSPSDIYKRNKFAVDGVSPGMVLQIPVPKNSKLGKKIAASTSPNDVATANPTTTYGAADDDAGYLPDNASAVAERTPPSAVKSTHTVQAGETLSGIAKKYGLSLAELKALNPVVEKRPLQIGQSLKLSTE